MLGEILQKLQITPLKSLKSALNIKSPVPHPASSYQQISYSQCGEDLILDFIAHQCGIKIQSYFDIGANHPYHYSNSYLFYTQGASGVCVEPIPDLAEKLAKDRPRDTVKPCVISANANPQTFYVLEPSTLSTFDSNALERALKTPGCSIVESIKVSAVSLNELFEEHGSPQLLCIDVEGGDLDVLASWDIKRFRPPLLCVEDLEYSAIKTTRRTTGVTDYLCNNGYMLFANTFINSILVDASIWVDT